MPTDAIVFGGVLVVAMVLALAIYYGLIDPRIRPDMYGGQ